MTNLIKPWLSWLTFLIFCSFRLDAQIDTWLKKSRQSNYSIKITMCFFKCPKPLIKLMWTYLSVNANIRIKLNLLKYRNFSFLVNNVSSTRVCVDVLTFLLLYYHVWFDIFFEHVKLFLIKKKRKWWKGFRNFKWRQHEYQHYCIFFCYQL